MVDRAFAIEIHSNVIDVYFCGCKLWNCDDINSENQICHQNYKINHNNHINHIDHLQTLCQPLSSMILQQHTLVQGVCIMPFIQGSCSTSRPQGKISKTYQGVALFGWEASNPITRGANYSSVLALSLYQCPSLSISL